MNNKLLFFIGFGYYLSFYNTIVCCLLLIDLIVMSNKFGSVHVCNVAHMF